jgi:RecA-family ATPase
MSIKTVVKPTQKAKIFTFSQMMEAPKEPEWIIKDLFTAGSVVTIYGDGGSKKTYSMIDMAMCYMTKNNWLGFEIPKNNPVLIVDEESGKNRLSMRYREAIAGHRIKKLLPLTTACFSGFDFRNTNDCAELQMMILSCKAKVVIIDTLMDVLDGGDDNSSKDVAPLYKKLRVVAGITGSVIIIIHHANKMNGYRGSTAIKGGSDLMIQISSKTTSPNIDFKTEKERDIAHVEWAAVSYFDKGKMFYLTSSVKKISKMGKVQEHVLNYLYSNPNATLEDMKTNKGNCSANSIKPVVYKLVDMGYLSIDKKGHKSIFELSEMGNNYADMYLTVNLGDYLSKQ